MRYCTALDVGLKASALCVVDETGSKLAIILHVIWVDGTWFEAWPVNRRAAA